MIKAIVFDFGNVLYNLNFNAFFENIFDLLGEDFSKGFPPSLLSTFEQYEIGAINTETFIWNIQHFKKGNVDPRAIVKCWNSMLDRFPNDRWMFLEQLKQKYPLYLLSNINELHLSKVYKHMKEEHGKIDFEIKYFNAVFYSHIIGLRKPNPEIYSLVESLIHVKSEEILFIDDNKDNVLSARAFGWNAVLHNPENNIVECFFDYINLYRND